VDEIIINGPYNYAFNTLKPGAYKSDLWRYCILYKKGGVYLDIKYYSLVPLVNIIEKNPLIFVRDIPGACLGHNGIYNAFMVSAPNNNIFKLCIEDIVNSCKNRLYKRNMLDLTGPCLLGEVVTIQYSDNYINTLQFAFKESWGVHIILYNNVEILKMYKEYRKEQTKFQKTKHYGYLWDTKNVYN
jgi:mannosyltransferase OCH1-like enzyme